LSPALTNELSSDSKKDIADCFLRLADAGVVAAPQATAQPLNLSIFVPRREPSALSEEFRWPLARSTLHHWPDLSISLQSIRDN